MAEALGLLLGGLCKRLLYAYFCFIMLCIIYILFVYFVYYLEAKSKSSASLFEVDLLNLS